MAQHKSVIRQCRRSLRRNEVNKRNKSILRTKIKNLKTAIKNDDKEEAQKLLPETISIIDKSIKKNTIHRNKGNRYKSRLTRQAELINPSPAK
ncbi:MAG: 30S ribosomal protein S20 [Candidatus Aminicenantes bacterium]|nr:30S ribosomal protein S20 [Candidatus Aminicenantes bacterium]